MPIKRAVLPRNDYVLIQRIDDAYTHGRIIVPDIAKEKGIKGKVISVGPKVTEVKPGALVYFASKWNDLADTHYHDQSPIHFDQNMHLVQEADIFCLFNT